MSLQEDLVYELKAVKNPTEIEAMKRAHVCEQRQRERSQMNIDLFRSKMQWPCVPIFIGWRTMFVHSSTDGPEKERKTNRLDRRSRGFE